MEGNLMGDECLGGLSNLRLKTEVESLASFGNGWRGIKKKCLTVLLIPLQRKRRLNQTKSIVLGSWLERIQGTKYT